MKEAKNKDDYTGKLAGQIEKKQATVMNLES